VGLQVVGELEELLLLLLFPQLVEEGEVEVEP
jgi:hypothetical protein